MSSARKYILLVFAILFNLQLASNVFAITPDSVTETFRGSFQLQDNDNYTVTSDSLTHTVSSRARSWNAARRSCHDQGGHLAIVNSVAEAEAIGLLFNKSNIPYGWVGLHDLYEEDEFVTIHGQPLEQTGYDVWRSGNPDNYKNNEHCVLLNSNGELIDETCTNRFSFVCEFPQVQGFVTSILTQPSSTTSPESVNIGLA